MLSSEGLLLRNAKLKRLDEEPALSQNSFAFGYLLQAPFEDAAEPERKPCMTIGGLSGRRHEAPGYAMYRFKEIIATCADIAAL